MTLTLTWLKFGATVFCIASHPIASHPIAFNITRTEFMTIYHRREFMHSTENIKWKRLCFLLNPELIFMLNDFLWTKRKNILKVSYLKYKMVKIITIYIKLFIMKMVNKIIIIYDWVNHIESFWFVI